MIEALGLAGLAPDIDPDSAPFWAALADGRLIAGRCAACGRASFPPVPACPHCGAARPAAEPVSGAGTIYSWVTVHIALDPRFAGDVPYAIVAVELAEGPRIFGRWLGTPAEIAPGRPVRFAPYRTGELVLPGFRPA
jgi:uncharacterized OB-fold protein